METRYLYRIKEFKAKTRIFGPPMVKAVAVNTIFRWLKVLASKPEDKINSDKIPNFQFSEGSQ